MTARNTLFSLKNVTAHYNKVLALKGVSIEVGEGEIVTLIGANGAGKSTTLKSISGLIKPERGEVTRGSIDLDGRRLDRMEPAQIVKHGVAQVFEGRRVFEHLNIRENLIAGAHTNSSKAQINEDMERVLSYFPRLRERMKVSAGYLSGGEQQMLAIGRGLMSRPKLLLLDEPSLGLAPRLVDQVFRLIAKLHDEGMTILLVEQNVAQTLRVVDRAYLIRMGQVQAAGTPEELRRQVDMESAYLGATVAAGRGAKAP